MKENRAREEEAKQWREEQEQQREKKNESMFSGGFGIFDKIYKYMNKPEAKEDKEERERKEIEKEKRLLYGISSQSTTGTSDLVSKNRRPLPVDFVTGMSINVSGGSDYMGHELQPKKKFEHNFASPGKF